MGELVDLDRERALRAHPCPGCGQRPPVPPTPDEKWQMAVEELLCLNDDEAGFIMDPLQDPRLYGDPGLDLDE